MTASKVSVSLDPVVAQRAREDIAAGKAKSLSAWLNEAGRARVERDDRRSDLAYGPLQARVARLLNSDEVSVEPLTGAAARATGTLCGAAETSDVVDASVVIAARR